MNGIILIGELVGKLKHVNNFVHVINCGVSGNSGVVSFMALLL